MVLDTEMKHEAPTDEPHGSWQYDYLVVGQRDFEAACFSADPAFVRPGLVGDARVGFDVTCKPDGAMRLVLGEGTGSVDLTAASEPGAC